MAGMPETPPLCVVAAQIERDGRYLITQRRPGAVLPLLWEFPGGKLEDGETKLQCLIRELEHRIGVKVQDPVKSMEVLHPYSGYTLRLVVYSCTLAEDQEPQALNCHAVKWVLPEELGEHDFPGADQESVDQLLGI